MHFQPTKKPVIARARSDRGNLVTLAQPSRASRSAACCAGRYWSCFHTPCRLRRHPPDSGGLSLRSPKGRGNIVALAQPYQIAARFQRSQ